MRERLGSLDELALETRRRLEVEPHDMYGWLPLMYAQGVFGGQALLGPLENARYPEIEAETVTQAIARGALQDQAEVTTVHATDRAVVPGGQ